MAEQRHNERECWCGIDHGLEARQASEMWVCSKHDRWTKIVRPEGDTIRPCPECPYGRPAPQVKSKRQRTGLLLG